MRNLLRTAFVWILAHGFLHGHGQNYSFELLNTSQGLPSAETLALATDHKGYLWIGTNVGLSKYDGYNFDNFQYSSDNHFIGKVNVIREDGQYRLWIGADAGLFVQVNNNIYKISDHRISQQGVNAIFPEKDGSLWLGTKAGIVFLDKRTVSALGTQQPVNLKKFVLPLWNSLELSEPAATIVTKSNDGTYYFSGTSALYRYNGQNLEPVYQCSRHHDLISQIIPVTKNKLYFFTSLSGWHKIENGTYTKLAVKDMYLPEVKPAEQPLWVLGTLHVYRFFPGSGIITEQIDLREHGIPWVSDMLVDRQKNIWVATHDGLLKFKPTFFQTWPGPEYPLPPEVFSMTETQDKNLLLGSNRGQVFTRSGNTLKSFFAGRGIVPLAEVFAIYEDENKWLWFATGYEGIAVLRNNTLKNFTVKNGLGNNSNYFFYKTRQGRFFAMGDGGIREIIVDTGTKEVSFKNYHHPPAITQYAKFYSCLEAPDGTLWMGGQEGIFYLHSDSLKPFRLLNKYISVTDIKADQKGNIWIATEGQGVLKCAFAKNGRLQLTRQYDHLDGLHTDVFNKLLIDRNANIWITSYKGLSFIGSQEDRILNFDGNDGFFKTSFYGLTLYQDQKGIIWTGCSRGLISFDPDKILISTYKPPVYITGVNLTGTQTNIFQFAESVAENLPVHLSLPHNRNNLRFQFTAIDFSNQENLQYLYKLEGNDTNWINAGQLRYGFYQHLPPGTFTFQVKAINNKGIESVPASFTFTITKPFWQTWGFMLFTGSMLAGGLFFLMKRREKIILQREEAKTKVQQLVSQNLQYQLEALENKQKATEARLQSMRLQMNPHFLFNALNSIQQKVLTGDETIAVRSLSKFSKLLRLVLIHSDKENITLREELETLQLYIELESLRFKSTFEYNIICDSHVDQEETLIPTMLVQPFVENAIWHGLMHKKGTRKLQVHFTEDTNNTLVCIIEDNGIGREAAGRIRESSMQENMHTGRGIIVTEERLKIFSEQYYNNSSVEIMDLKDPDGKAAGTKIIIKLPISR